MLAWAGVMTQAQAADVPVAVAANFAAPMQRIADAFAQDSGHRALLSFGSTGKLYAQISHGAPFQLLLAADGDTPARLQAQGLAVAGTRATYALGRLALWSAQAGRVDGQGAVLRSGSFERLAVADPKLAPYGRAAFEVMAALGLRDALAPKLVQGESIAQAYLFVASGNAPLGFVALSQVFADGRLTQGSAWLVPGPLYSPIRQDAVLLNPGKDQPAAAALLRYLQGEKARAIIRSHGYALPG